MLQERYEETPGADSSRTFAQTIDDYITQVREPLKRSSKVIEREALFQRTMVKFMGSRKVIELSVRDCDAYLAALITGRLTGTDQPIGRDYVRRARSFMQHSLRNDIRQGFVSRNPAEIAIIPASTAPARRARRALSTNEWRQLHSIARKVIAIGIDLGGRHALRPQETRAVRWSEIDWDNQTLSVVTQFDAEDKFVEPKTTNSTRTIHIHHELFEYLADWQSVQKRQQGEDWKTDGLIVATRAGRPIQHGNYRQSVRRICEKAGVPIITPYELRHTAITHQIEAGRSASQVADWAGTSERMIYLHYRHKMKEIVDTKPLDYEG